MIQCFDPEVSGTSIDCHPDALFCPGERSDDWEVPDFALTVPLPNSGDDYQSRIHSRSPQSQACYFSNFIGVLPPDLVFSMTRILPLDLIVVSITNHLPHQATIEYNQLPLHLTRKLTTNTCWALPSCHALQTVQLHR